MNRKSLLALASLSALVIASAPAYAQTPPAAAHAAIGQDKSEIRKDDATLSADEREIRELERKRDEALRAKNTNAAAQFQAQIDQKRGARRQTRDDLHKTESDVDRQKREAAEACARNPECAKKKRHEEITRQLESSRQRLAADNAAAARIPQDRAEIEKLENELKQ